jgi:hypothetical protein
VTLWMPGYVVFAVRNPRLTLDAHTYGQIYRETQM